MAHTVVKGYKVSSLQSGKGKKGGYVPSLGGVHAFSTAGLYPQRTESPEEQGAACIEVLWDVRTGWGEIVLGCCSRVVGWMLKPG